MLLERNRAHLLVVDIQARLLPHIYNADQVLLNTELLLVAARRLGVPVTVSEQYPKGLGPTVDKLNAFIEGAKVMEKMHFSCAADAEIRRRVRHLDQAEGRDQLVIVGIEAHVCVLQSALGFAQAGQHVAVVADATGSRRLENHEKALKRLRHNDIEVVTAEMVLFEWLGVAGTDEFRELSKLIK
jgi:nicotinamidase-related amidase